MERILCPVDLKPDTLNALEAAAHLAATHNAQLLLLHVLSRQEYDDALEAGDGDMAQIDALQNQQEQSMLALCDSLRESVPKLQCTAQLRYGSTISTILEEAKNFRSNLIVMGSHGVHDITEAMGGNHPVKVIEQSCCPVLCVPAGVTLEVPRKVVYGSRMKQEDPACIQQLSNLLLPFNSRIEVVYVGEQTTSAKKRWQEHEQMIRSYINSDKLRFHFFPFQDEAYQGLDAFVQQQEADLLVLLTHQRNYFERLFQKSVFKQMTYFSDFPLLVFLEDHLAAAEK